PSSRDTLTINGILHLPVEGENWTNALSMILVDLYTLGSNETWATALEKHRAEYDLMRKRVRGIEHDTDKRLLMGDDTRDPGDLFYGNPILQAEGHEHGTIVAGVISGQGVGDSTI